MATTPERDQDAQDAVVAIVRQAITSTGDKPEKVAALVRTNYQARWLRDWCEEEGIFCDIDTGGNLFASPACADLLALVNALIDPGNTDWMYRLQTSPYSTNWPHWGSLLQFRGDTEKISEALAEQPPSPAWIELLAKRRLVPAQALIHEAIVVMGPASNVAAIQLAELEEQFPGEEETVLQAEARERADDYGRDLEAILAEVDEQFPGGFVGLYEIANWLELQRATNRDVDHPAKDNLDTKRMRCLTVHSAKGMEFDTVVIPFTSRDWRDTFRDQVFILKNEDDPPRVAWKMVSDDSCNEHFSSFAGAEAAETCADEARLLYVALTRAKNRLYILRSTRYRGRRDTNWASLLEENGNR